MSPSRPKKRMRTSVSGHNSLRSKFCFEKPGLSTTLARGKHALKWLLSDVCPETFFNTHFEKKPFIAHNSATKFQQLTSIASIRTLVESGKLRYGSDLDVTHYTKEGGRTTHNGEHGSIVGKEAWENFSTSDCSIRLLRPQEHFEAIWHLCTLLEGYFGCVVGANTYLTPSSSQGFAPHFDDVDAFVCQVQGRKRWRVYKRRADKLDYLPRNSSIDFTAEDMKSWEVLLDVVLAPGDMLYMPRGFVHQAECERGEGNKDGSLHVTISAFQKWTWADLLLASFENAIRSAAAEDAKLRKTLPLRFIDFMGVSKRGERKEQSEWFDEMLEKMAKRVAEAYPSDMAADVMAARFMRERLPPVVNGTREGKVEAKSKVKVVGAGVVRIVLDDSVGGDGLPRMIHCLDNERGAGKKVDGGISCLPEEANAVNVLIKSYPKAVVVRELPLEKVEDCVDLAQGLIEMGIVEIEE